MNFSNLHIDNNTLLVEPSAGNGAFMKKLQPYSICCLRYRTRILRILSKKDFLTVDLNDFNKPLAFIGNPPFGRQSSLAKKFIKHITKCSQYYHCWVYTSKKFQKRKYAKMFSTTLPSNQPNRPT